MNIWDLLRRNNPNQQQQQQSQQQGTQQQQQGGEQQQQQQQMQANPAGFPANGDDNNPFKELDVLSLLLDNSQQQQNQAPQFNIPRDKLQEIAGNINFLQNIPQELTAGLDENTLKALMPLLNFVGQQSYTNALEHSMQLSGKYLDSRFDFEREGLNSSVRQQAVTNNINSIDKLHPMMQDLFRTAASRLAKEFPTATAQQIEQQVWKMMSQVGNNIDNSDPSKVQQRQAQASKEQDWDVLGGFVQPDSQGNFPQQ